MRELERYLHGRRINKKIEARLIDLVSYKKPVTMSEIQ